MSSSSGAFFFFSSRRWHTRCYRDWSSDVCSSDLRQLQRVHIGLTGQEQLGAVAVQHGGGAAAVAVLELPQVVPDGHQLDALAAGGRGEFWELGQGGAVAGLVQA